MDVDPESVKREGSLSSSFIQTARVGAEYRGL